MFLLTLAGNVIIFVLLCLVFKWVRYFRKDETYFQLKKKDIKIENNIVKFRRMSMRKDAVQKKHEEKEQKLEGLIKWI